MSIPIIGKKSWMMRRFEAAQNAKLLQDIRDKADAAYGCHCDWCAWRQHNVNIEQMDPGPNPAAEGCKHGQKDGAGNGDDTGGEDAGGEEPTAA